ncbi:hypothetical protein GOP47_0012095 [Adiantum capillus-veneris]|uniref:Uncharacterized protein n=1 Tax=Adiantum capillus-veneris TaxID=13818 RepID=A0A9D4UQ26_ADICA|nr:hypothetical protein GOP47_0012095 [Adiantum capillus-veneris]
MEKAEDSKDAVSSRELQQAPPAEAFSSGLERGVKPGVQHKQDNVSIKPSLNIKSNISTEASQREKTADSTLVVSINDRKVKVGADSDSTSLYTLCRRWLRNDAPRKEQPGVHNFAKLPKPLPAKKEYLDGEIEAPEGQVLLDSHIKHFKNVRKRLREQHKQRIERYKLRLALLLQPSPYQEKLDASMHS